MNSFRAFQIAVIMMVAVKLQGKANSGISILWNEMINHDLSLGNTTFSIPVYFCHGKFDYTCSDALAKEYFEKIQAPKRSFSPLITQHTVLFFEEPQECVRVLRERILEGR